MPSEAAAQVPAGCARTYRAWAEGALVILFSIGIVLPLLGYLADVKIFSHNDLNKQPRENQPQTGTPTWSSNLSSLLTVPKRFEQHFNDRFGFRSHLVDLCSRIKVFALGDSSSHSVTLGRNGWLFFAWEEAGHSARQPRPFSRDVLQKWRNVLETRRSWLKQRDCHYLFVVAPEKESVYPQYLPHWRPEQPQIHTRLVQLKDCLRGGAVDVLDLGDSLRDVASHERQYHLTDTHWNGRGAFTAYSSIIRKLSQHFDNVKPLPPSRIRRTANVTEGLDLARMLGCRGAFKEEDLGVMVVEPRARGVIEDVEFTESQKMPFFWPMVFVNTDQELPKAILTGDSFSFAMLPFLAEHFSRLVYLPEHALDPMVIERERPDVVIQEIVERKLFYVPPYDPVCEPPYPDVQRLAVEEPRRTH